jgi:GNAT superfamily N-acetyltransferase
VTAPGWSLRPWQTTDRSETSSLGSVHGPPSDASGRQSLTLIASQGAILGAGTIYESPVAPARWRLALQVHPAHRRQGIGAALLDALAAEAARRDGRALQVGLSYAATDSVDFFMRRGFRYLMRTRLGTIDPTRIPASIWLQISEAERWVQRLALQIRSLTEREDRVLRIPAVADLHAAIYRQSHHWSPLAPLDPETAAALYLGDDLIPAALFVAFDGDRPIGVSSLRRSESELEFDLGWTGVLTEFGPNAPELTLALLGRTSTFAREATRPTNIEVDAADLILWDLIGTLPVSYKPDWFNLDRPNNLPTTTRSS